MKKESAADRANTRNPITLATFTNDARSATNGSPLHLSGRFTSVFVAQIAAFCTIVLN